MIKRLIVFGLLAVIVVGALAWWVLESSGVAIVETRRPDGGLRETHVWYVRSGDALWLEAGQPTHPWYLDIQKDPSLVLRADGRSAPYSASPVLGQAAHDFVRRLIRDKYGLRDEILGWAIDTSRSVAVRLTPLPPGAAKRPKEAEGARVEGARVEERTERPTPGGGDRG